MKLLTLLLIALVSVVGAFALANQGVKITREHAACVKACNTERKACVAGCAPGDAACIHACVLASQGCKAACR